MPPIPPPISAPTPTANPSDIQLAPNQCLISNANQMTSSEPAPDRQSHPIHLLSGHKRVIAVPPRAITTPTTNPATASRVSTDMIRHYPVNPPSRQLTNYQHLTD